MSATEHEIARRHRTPFWVSVPAVGSVVILTASEAYRPGCRWDR